MEILQAPEIAVYENYAYKIGKSIQHQYDGSYFTQTYLRCNPLILITNDVGKKVDMKTKDEMIEWIHTMRPRPKQEICFLAGIDGETKPYVPPRIISGNLQIQLDWFLHEVKEEPTYFLSNTHIQQCGFNKNRSIQDIYFWLYQFNHDLTLADVMHAMFERVEQGIQPQFVCGTISHRVFPITWSSTACYDIHYRIEAFDEFGLHFPEWREI